jgi:hypothetical protein
MAKYSLAHLKGPSYPLLKEHTISRELEITAQLFPENTAAIFHH